MSANEPWTISVVVNTEAEPPHLLGVLEPARPDDEGVVRYYDTGQDEEQHLAPEDCVEVYRIGPGAPRPWLPEYLRMEREVVGLRAELEAMTGERDALLEQAGEIGRLQAENAGLRKALALGTKAVNEASMAMGHIETREAE